MINFLRKCHFNHSTSEKKTSFWFPGKALAFHGCCLLWGPHPELPGPGSGLSYLFPVILVGFLPCALQALTSARKHQPGCPGHLRHHHQPAPCSQKLVQAELQPWKGPCLLGHVTVVMASKLRRKERGLENRLCVLNKELNILPLQWVFSQEILSCLVMPLWWPPLTSPIFMTRSKNRSSN